MPYKSKAQAGKMHEMEKRGQIKSSVVKEFDAASKGKMGHLPEHIAQRPKHKPKEVMLALHHAKRAKEARG